MGSILLIAGNTFREILSMKLVYAVLLVGFGILALYTLPMAMFDRAMLGGEDEALHAAKLVFMYMTLYGFWTLCIILALLLGAMAVPNEIKRRTIVTILPRPVDRWQFLAGKLLGTMAFLMVVQTAGMLIAVCLAWYFQFYPSTIIVYSVADFYLSVALCATMAFSLGTLTSPPGAFAFTVVWLYLMPFAAWGLEFAIRPSLRRLGEIIERVLPATMPDDLLELSFRSELLNPNHTLYQMVLAENALHAVAVFCLACLVFTRRQIIVTG